MSYIKPLTSDHSIKSFINIQLVNHTYINPKRSPILNKSTKVQNISTSAYAVTPLPNRFQEL